MLKLQFEYCFFYVYHHLGLHACENEMLLFRLMNNKDLESIITVMLSA